MHVEGVYACRGCVHMQVCTHVEGVCTCRGCVHM